MEASGKKFKEDIFITEIWKDITGYQGKYQVSNIGNIRKKNKDKRFNSWRILKGRIEFGYQRISLGKEKKRCFAHRLVAIEFIENRENKPNINHINGIRNDNRVGNLEWVTHRENMSCKIFGEKTSKYIGVSKQKNTNKWISTIKIEDKCKYLGTFENEIDAANMYIEKMKEHNIINKYGSKRKEI